MSAKRERPNSFTGLLNLAKPVLPSTGAPGVPEEAAERALGLTEVPTEVSTEMVREGSAAAIAIKPSIPASVHTEVSTEEQPAVLAPILRNRKKKERLLSWTVRLPESLKSRLERASKQYDIDMTAIVVAGTRDYLDRYFPEE